MLAGAYEKPYVIAPPEGKLTAPLRTPNMLFPFSVGASRAENGSTPKSAAVYCSKEAVLIYGSNAGFMSKSCRDFREGSIVKGRILEIRPREVLVDIGYKSEGVIPLR